MSASDPLLDPDAIEEAFWRLGDRLARRGLVADVYVSVGVMRVITSGGTVRPG